MWVPLPRTSDFREVSNFEIRFYHGQMRTVHNPSTVAKTIGNKCVGILVPTVQDRTFASANIVVAMINEDNAT